MSTAPPASREPLAAGTRVGRFVIVQRVAVGGMGALYRAFDPELDRVVALKIVGGARRDAANHAVSVERLLREAKGLGKLAHPNVVTVFDAGTHDDGVFIAMEFVEGRTLREWAKGTHSVDDRVAVLADAARGLAAAHAAGLVHRDFKPDNVLVGTDGRARVVDFGLVRDTRSPDADVEWARSGGESPTSSAQFSVARTPLTQLGSVVGTPAYMAPEQLRGLDVDARADQFSFGVTLFEVLFGRGPFRGSTWREFVASVTSGVFSFPARPRVPAGVRELLTRALHRDPAQRFESMDAVVAELDRVRAPRRHKVEVATAVAALLTVALVAFVHGRRASAAAVCATDASELAGIWDGHAQATMVQAFEATSSPGAREAAERVAQRLDGFTRDWLTMRTDACRSARISKEQPESVYRLRSDCLDRERSELRAVTALLTSADAQVVKRSLDLAYGLPNVSWCADVATLRASAGLPNDPEKRERVKTIRDKLADAHSRELAGKLADALANADEAVTLARAADHPATTAEALFFAGALRGRQGDFAAEVPMLKEAYLRASSSGADSIVVRISGVLSFVLGPKLQRAEEARDWLERARVALDRMGGNEELALTLEEREASLRIEVDGRPDLAIPIQEKIVAAYRATYGAAPSTAIALNNLGDAYSSLGDPERARPPLEDAVAIAEQVGGPTYLILGTSEQLLGQVQLEVGETQRGEASLERALAIFEEDHMPYWSALALERLAASALARGDAELARARADRAEAAFREAKAPNDLLATVDVTRGLALVDVRPREAFELCASALAEEEKEKAIDPDQSYGWDALRCEAEARLAEGRSTEAVAPLERSLTLKKRSFRGDYARAEFGLARALAETDRRRAVELAKAARSAFASLPFLSFELARVDAWLAKRR